MRWYRNLYLGPGAAPHIQSIRKKAKAKTFMVGVYYITSPSISGNLLDIFHNGMLSQTLFSKEQCTDVIGVAEGRMEAYRLAEQIIWDVYQETGGFDLGSYFRSEDFMED